jgi:uncharacterized protein (DUF2062 family)
MFDRRIPRTLLTKLREVIWPRMGWRRALVYYWRRLQRVPGTPESIAAGFACGAAASMMPLMGLHFILAALFALALRSSIIASAFGTIVGNPWTFPFIWLGTYKLGGFFLGVDHEIEGDRLFLRMFAQMGRALRNFDTALLADNVWPIWWPMMLGSLPVAIAVGFMTYWLLIEPLRVGQRRRDRAMAKNAARSAPVRVGDDRR